MEIQESPDRRKKFSLGSRAQKRVGEKCGWKLRPSSEASRQRVMEQVEGRELSLVARPVELHRGGLAPAA